MGSTGDTVVTETASVWTGGTAMARVTLRTIAEQVGVSRMTVSNAFSRPDQLSPALRDKILKAAAELGYVGPHPSARALAKGTTGAVGVLLTDSLRLAFIDEVATGFLSAVADALTPTGLALTLLAGSPDEGDVVQARDVAIDGALIYSCDADSPGTAWLIRRNLPLVFVDQIPAPGRSSVNIDDRGGARAAAQHLVDLGHTRIGIVTSDIHGPYGLLDDLSQSEPGQVARERVAGWLDALAPAGIRPPVVRQQTYSPDADRESAALLLDIDPPLTAILCHSDAIAQSIVSSAQDRGLRVPQDLSVVGFDDNPLASRMRPALTTVRQDLVEKGRAAIAALTTQLDPAHADDPPTVIVLPTELVVRESTAPPRG
jgi:DNA-binding LacI/PurR family transcriptional regulator